MSMKDFRHLKAGDRVRLTGESWGSGYRGSVVTVDRVETGNGYYQLVSNLPEVDTLTNAYARPYGGSWDIEEVSSEEASSDGVSGSVEGKGVVEGIVYAVETLVTAGFDRSVAVKFVSDAIEKGEVL